MRNSGCVSRSAPYMILDRKYPLTQLSPRLTSALASAWVATTRLPLTATRTPQPVPQNRHGAFDHFSLVNCDSVMMFWAGAFELAAAMADAAALRRMNCRRFIVMLFFQGRSTFHQVRHDRNGEHAG